MKCAKCGSGVKSKPSVIGVLSVTDFNKKMAGTGYFCPSCEKGFCSKCTVCRQLKKRDKEAIHVLIVILLLAIIPGREIELGIFDAPSHPYSNC
jgi:hypothetical protein